MWISPWVHPNFRVDVERYVLNLIAEPRCFLIKFFIESGKFRDHLKQECQFSKKVIVDIEKLQTKMKFKIYTYNFNSVISIYDIEVPTFH